MCYNGIESSHTICIIKNISSIDCFGCGITRAIIELINGNFNAAINYNFSVIIVFPMIVYIWIKTFIKSISKLSFIN